MRRDDTGALLALGLWTLAVFFAGGAAGWSARDRQPPPPSLTCAYLSRDGGSPIMTQVVFPAGWWCEGRVCTPPSMLP